LSFIILLAFSLLFFILLGKIENLNYIKSIFLFLVFFLNPASFVSFFALGRLPTLESFALLILGFVILRYYKNKKLDLKFLVLFTIFFSVLILNHPSVTILYSFLLLGFMLNKKIKENIILISSFIISIALTSFWWVGFIQQSGVQLKGFTAINFTNLISYGTFISLAFIIIFFIQKKSKKELIFYLPSLILSLLYLTRLLTFIPYLNKIWPNAFNLYFTFLATFLLLKTNFKDINIKRIAITSIQIIPFVVIVFLFLYPTNFTYSEIDKKVLNVMPKINEDVLIVNPPNKDIPVAAILYAYGAIQHNISTPSGFFYHSAPLSLLESLDQVTILVKEKECSKLKKELKELKTPLILTYYDYCTTLKDCNFKEEINDPPVCLFKNTID